MGVPIAVGSGDHLGQGGGSGPGPSSAPVTGGGGDAGCIDSRHGPIFTSDDEG